MQSQKRLKQAKTEQAAVAQAFFGKNNCSALFFLYSIGKLCVF
jgi:hypothetical protein